MFAASWAAIFWWKCHRSNTVSKLLIGTFLKIMESKLDHGYRYIGFMALVNLLFWCCQTEMSGHLLVSIRWDLFTWSILSLDWDFMLKSGVLFVLHVIVFNYNMKILDPNFLYCDFGLSSFLRLSVHELWIYASIYLEWRWCLCMINLCLNDSRAYYRTLHNFMLYLVKLE